jgi:hypothetical protein
MTPDDIETYRPLGVEEDLGRYDAPDPTLTPAEAGALTALQLTDGKYLRIEQERIPIGDAEHALALALNAGQLMTSSPTLSNGPNIDYGITYFRDATPEA